MAGPQSVPLLTLSGLTLRHVVITRTCVEVQAFVFKLKPWLFSYLASGECGTVSGVVEVGKSCIQEESS